MSFHCPIHHTDQYQNVDIDCIVDTITISICPQCETQRQRLQPALGWFYHTRDKFPSQIKQLLKQSHLDYYSECDVLENKDVPDYICLRYLHQQPVYIKIYQYWRCKPNQYRISFSSQKRGSTIDIEYDQGMPLHLAQDNAWLTRTFLDKE